MSSLFSHDQESSFPGPQEEASQGNDEKVKLFIGNLSWSVTSEELSEYLSQAGMVTSCEVKRNHNGQSKGFALATFADVESAKEAIVQFNDVEMQGRRLIVRVDSRPEDRPARPMRDSSFQGRGRGGRSGEERPRRAEGAPCERVFCGNLPFATTQQEFESLFVGCSYAKIITDDDGHSKGYGIVTFNSVDEAQDAINRYNGFSVDGRPIRCKFDALPPK